MDPNALELTRKIYSDVLDWYKAAESKAQILLGLIGSFIVFISGIILGNPEEITVILANFSWVVWSWLGLTFAAMLFCLFAAFKCLWSRINVALPEEAGNNQVPYPTERLYFFGHHANHQPARLYHTLRGVNPDKELQIYAAQIIILSRNVVKKHRWINRGIIAICLSILFLLLSTVFYTINLSS